MTKYVELNKRTKKEQKAYYSKLRTVTGFNTGTRTMKSEKYPSRQDRKKDLKKMLDKSNY